MADATPEHDGHEASGTGAHDAMQRADALLTDMGHRLGQWSARLQRESTRLAARTREEFEDIWAEAQALRHQEHSPSARDEQPVRITDVPTSETSRPAEEQRHEGRHHTERHHTEHHHAEHHHEGGEA